MAIINRLWNLRIPRQAQYKNIYQPLFSRSLSQSVSLRTPDSNTVPKAKHDTSSTAQELRLALRNFASSVVVITTTHPTRPQEKVGITLSSFTSVSLKPPIISFCVKPPSRFSKTLHESNRFVVNILGTKQIPCSRAFSTPNLPQDPFEEISHSLCPYGNPVLDGNLVTLHCITERVLDVGDHEVWMGEVIQVENNHTTNDSPLIYHDRNYATVNDVLTLSPTEEID
ncbi:hypothetical protein K7432_001990 [Basidiobolus ranarum]|uniref:Flavin reductase like domain-containing protein n=1 Tax=Basidiobolus ranarum TaxID=34480 RepID=A0ABR2W9E7_9FUNG